MKKISMLFFTIVLLSCAETKNYYQLYKVSAENYAMIDDKIIFEDKNCRVGYNLWANGGDIGFAIYNKTETDLTLDLTKTFFILNGVAYEYFQNRTFAKSATSGAALTTYNYPYYYYSYYYPSKITNTSSESQSTTYIEKPELTIPSKAQVNIAEYHISNNRYVNCDLIKYPSSGSVKTIKFDKSNSPYVFYNLVTYKTKGESSRMENRFYVSEITNYPEGDMLTKVDTSMCGRRLQRPEIIFKDVTPDKFYFKYKKENSFH